MHSAPWTKTSISTGLFLQIKAMSSCGSSRASTTRLTPSAAACRTPSREWMLIWVDAWSAICGAIWRQSASTPRSCTMNASTPARAAEAISPASFCISRSVTSVLSVRCT